MRKYLANHVIFVPFGKNMDTRTALTEIVDELRTIYKRYGQSKRP